MKRVFNMNELYHNAVHSLRRVSLLHRYRITLSLRSLNIYRGQPDILGYLLENGECSQRELAEHLEVSPASIATSLKRMSKAGYIERAEDEKDRRINRIRLTESGKEVFLAGRKICDKVDEMMFEGFSNDEIEALASMLDRISDNLSADGISEREAIKFIEKTDNKNGDDKND